MEDKNSIILDNQYHGCWCPGDRRSQGISSNGINLIQLKNYGFITSRFNKFFTEQTIFANRFIQTLQKSLVILCLLILYAFNDFRKHENICAFLSFPRTEMMQPRHQRLRSTSIRHQSDTFMSDWCLTDIEPKVFAIWEHNYDVIMGVMASQITSLTIV